MNISEICDIEKHCHEHIVLLLIQTYKRIKTLYVFQRVIPVSKQNCQLLIFLGFYNLKRF